MDRASLDKINILIGELQSVDQAIAVFEGGGRIVSLTVASAMNQEPARSVLVQTASMDYPSQMVEAIKGYLSARAGAIRKELEGLGFVDEEPPRRTR